MRILVVEDEKRLAEALAQILRENRYLVDLAFDGQEGLDNALSGIYDAVILDVMLPAMDGFALTAELRRQKVMTPVLMLTARDQIADKVAGLDSGADDYMTKPFSPEELLARVRALMRRQGEILPDEAVFEDLTLNLSSGDLRCGVRSVHLNYKEFEICRLLMANPRAAVSKETLIVKVWGYDSGAEDNNVEAYISFLRKKLAFLGSRVGIEALRKVGYRLEGNRTC
ncbi:MAG: response regulator transcription factor [Clostridiales bacterium]|nr:response regulator transcription factor [Clostridiales bacterium]